MMGRASWVVVVLLGCDGGRHPLTDGGPHDGLQLIDAPDVDAREFFDARIDAPIDAMIDAGPPPCVPRTCDLPTLACNAIPDGCGGPLLQCGSCDPGLVCGANEANVCGLAPANRWCLPSGYCWEHPLPFGTDLTATYGATATDIWATGKGGTIIRFDGTSWARQTSSTTSDLLAVWGTAANDVWVGGSQYLRHWNGTTLAAGTNPQTFYVHSIRGRAANDIWLAGDSTGNNDVAHYNGITWTGQSTGEFFSIDTIYPLSANLVFAFGFSSTGSQYANNAWTKLAAYPDWQLAQWGLSATDHWTVGVGGHHYDGSTFTEIAGLGGFQYAVDGLATNDVWVGGSGGLKHYDGSTVTTAADDEVNGLWLHAGATGMAVGDAGYSATFSGGTWTQRSGFGAKYQIDAIYGFGDHDVALVGDGVQTWHDGTVSSFGTLAGYSRAVWAISPTSAWTISGFGPQQLMHFDGSSWTAMASIAGVPTVVAIWGTSDTDIWAVTEPTDVFAYAAPSYVLHWNGTTLTNVFTTPWAAPSSSSFADDVRALGGTSATDVWIGDSYGHLGHWNGSTWDTAVTLPGGVSASNFWRSPTGTLWVGATDGIYRKSGASFIEVGDRFGAGKLSGTSDSDVFVVDSSDLAHWNGTTWTAEPVAAGASIVDVYATSTNIFVALSNHGLLRKTR